MDKAVTSLIEAARAAQRRYETWGQAGRLREGDLF